ncbi:dynamin family protein [Neolewinella lacunae]|uniref:Dynamin family protein n=1 Tax=Neolewinella lacunae TaxID=1517758 RepID=A0A923T9K7_9BACT|nr:dynamin family protein [Neolewinella lacunae]MBC6995173.1 dynamin family protein [Neolewinella lacunae]MDN3634123.1 dynamin family protein [Neolewinella lacunae]
MSQLINANLQARRARLEEIIKNLHELTVRIGHEDMAKTVSELRNRIFEPFMFVIVGEVKAGKSSFINALLATGEEIAKAAPQPMTDTIQQIIYGEERREITVNPYLKKIFLPVEILREIAIVDTPGTNTIVEHHQEITEQFIPASDLIVFVFEAKNPYRQSAWDFFKYIHADWRKKAIFVLQQKDLASANELAVNLQGVADKASTEGIENPEVFAVSAKAEQEGDPASGFVALRDYIASNITGGRAPALKLNNSVVTAQTINERIAAGLELRRDQFAADTRFREDIQTTLSDQVAQSNKQVDLMVENLLMSYDKITGEKLAELRDGLSMIGLLRRSLASTFGSTPDAKTWLGDLAAGLEEELNSRLRARLNENVVDLAESIQQMVKVIDLKIRTSQTILSNDHELFSDIAERRENVLRDLQDQFNRFVSNTESFTDKDLFADRENLAPNLAAGSGMAALGVILMALSTLPVLDVTGGVLTTVGVLFAGFSTRGKRKRIVEGFATETQAGRQRLATELDDKLKSYITTLRHRIEANFSRFDEMLGREEKNLAILEGMHAEISKDLEEMLAE